MITGRHYDGVDGLDTYGEEGDGHLTVEREGPDEVRIDLSDAPGDEDALIWPFGKPGIGIQLDLAAATALRDRLNEVLA